MSKRFHLPDLEPPEDHPQEEKWLTTGQMLVLCLVAGAVGWTLIVKLIMRVFGV